MKNKNLEHERSAKLYSGDCSEVLAGLPENSVDTCITDPPYELGFMGKKWDSSGIAFQPETWQAVYRVLKPGAILLAFGGTRTYHRMVCAIEDAGFEIRDTIAWVYGSGFPKSYDISKGMDKYDATEARRNRDLRFTAWMRSTGLTASEINEITNSFMGSHYLTDKEQPAVATADMFDKLRPHVGYVPQWVEKIVEERTTESENFKNREVIGKHPQPASEIFAGGKLSKDVNLTAPFTPEAQLWHGWGTALKPSHEPIVLAMKPIDGTFVNNALTWGVAGLWIDGGRVATSEVKEATSIQSDKGYWHNASGGVPRINGNGTDNPQGRFPANFVHDGSDEVVGLFPVTTSGGGDKGRVTFEGKDGILQDGLKPIRGNIAVANSGSAARFFYCAKASRSERNAGLEGMPEKQREMMAEMGQGNTPQQTPHKNEPQSNHHPTVKPIELMRYLVRLTKTPTGGIVLDPFAGSGTTGIAYVLERREFIGIEREAEYVEIAEKRIAHAENAKDGIKAEMLPLLTLIEQE